MRLLIMSDGTPHGTRVTDEYHKPIEGVIAVSWKHELREMPIATITLRGSVEAGMMVNLPDAEPEPAATTETPTDENRTTPEQTNPSLTPKRKGNTRRRSAR